MREYLIVLEKIQPATISQWATACHEALRIEGSVMFTDDMGCVLNELIDAGCVIGQGGKYVLRPEDKIENGLKAIQNRYDNARELKERDERKRKKELIAKISNMTRLEFKTILLNLVNDEKLSNDRGEEYWHEIEHMLNSSH